MYSGNVDEISGKPITVGLTGAPAVVFRRPFMYTSILAFSLEIRTANSHSGFRLLAKTFQPPSSAKRDSAINSYLVTSH